MNHITKERLFELAAGSPMTPDETNHLGPCPTCTTELDVERRLMTSLVAAASVEVPEGFVQAATRLYHQRLVSSRRAMCLTIIATTVVTLTALWLTLPLLSHAVVSTAALVAGAPALQRAFGVLCETLPWLFMPLAAAYSVVAVLGAVLLARVSGVVGSPRIQVEGV